MKKSQTLRGQIAAAQQEVEKWPPSIKLFTTINSYGRDSNFHEDESCAKQNKKNTHEGKAKLEC